MIPGKHLINVSVVSYLCLLCQNVSLMNILEWVSIRCEQTLLLAVAFAASHLQDGFIWCGMIETRLLSATMFDHQ